MGMVVVLGAKSLQLHLTLCDPMNCSPPGSSARGILQPRILEWVAISSSRGSSQLRDQPHVSYASCIGRQVLYRQCHLGSLRNGISSVQLLSHVMELFATPWIAGLQASLSITNSQSLLKLMSIESVMPSNMPSSVVPFSSHLQSFPASGSFPQSQFFASGGQSIGPSASASVLPMNIQD